MADLDPSDSLRSPNIDIRFLKVPKIPVLLAVPLEGDSAGGADVFDVFVERLLIGIETAAGRDPSWTGVTPVCSEVVRGRGMGEGLAGVAVAFCTFVASVAGGAAFEAGVAATTDLAAEPFATVFDFCFSAFLAAFCLSLSSFVFRLSSSFFFFAASLSACFFKAASRAALALSAAALAAAAFSAALADALASFARSFLLFLVLSGVGG